MNWHEHYRKLNTEYEARLQWIDRIGSVIGILLALVVIKLFF